MKKITWVIMMLLLATLVSGFATSEKNDKKAKAGKAECVLEDLATSGLGDVKYSILSEAKFQMVNGSEWVLLSGQSQAEIESAITDSSESVFEYLDFAENFSMGFLPNAGGSFLRGQNFANTPVDQQNPEPKKLGEFQVDEFKSHNHNAYYTGGWGNWAGSNRFATTNSTHTSPVWVNYTGGSETRGKNITVNIFIKVKRKCLDDVAVTKIVAAEDRIQAIENFNTINTCDTCIDYAESTLPEKHAKFICFKGEIDLYETSQKQWSVSCVARTVGNTKKVLMQIGEPERTPDEKLYLEHLDDQYPYYNVISTTLPYYKKTQK